jgi:hypothetical protein
MQRPAIVAIRDFDRPGQSSRDGIFRCALRAALGELGLAVRLLAPATVLSAKRPERAVEADTDCFASGGAERFGSLGSSMT